MARFHGSPVSFAFPQTPPIASAPQSPPQIQINQVKQKRSESENKLRFVERWGVRMWSHIKGTCLSSPTSARETRWELFFFSFFFFFSSPTETHRSEDKNYVTQNYNGAKHSKSLRTLPSLSSNYTRIQWLMQTWYFAVSKGTSYIHTYENRRLAKLPPFP